MRPPPRYPLHGKAGGFRIRLRAVNGVQMVRQAINEEPNHVSNLNFVDARPYSPRQIRRLSMTTMAAIPMVAASSTWKFPVSVAWLITAPSPKRPLPHQPIWTGTDLHQSPQQLIL